MKHQKNKTSSDLQSRLSEHLLNGGQLLGSDSPITELLQNTINSILEGEIESHLSEDRHSESSNKRNGYTSKHLRSAAGELEIQTPRDRNSSFDPTLVAKRQRQLSTGLDEQILALYAQGNSVEDIRRLVSKLYGIELSAGKISAITDQVLPQVEAWRRRPLQSMYAVLYLDAIIFKVRHEHKYNQRAFYTVYGVDLEGRRDILGFYMQANEGAKHWAEVLSDIQQRGVEDVLVICTDNLSGFSQAIDKVYPQAVIQKCIVHQVRNSVRFASDKESKAICKDLRKLYTAHDRQSAQLVLDSLYVAWPAKQHKILDSWVANWDELFAFMDFPTEIRRMIYTTNPVEAVHRIVRRLVKSKAAWASETALFKQLYLSLMHNEKSWKRNAFSWKAIMEQLLELYGDRLRKHMV